MKILLIILMFCFSVYMGDLIKYARVKDKVFFGATAAYYACIAVVTVAYLGVCTYLIYLLR